MTAVPEWQTLFDIARRRRSTLAADLLDDGIGTLILESPYYGTRKPEEQSSAKVRYVSDLIKLGAMTILESLYLVQMLRQSGITKVCRGNLLLRTLHLCAAVALTRVFKENFEMDVASAVQDYKTTSKTRVARMSCADLHLGHVHGRHPCMHGRSTQRRACGMCRHAAPAQRSSGVLRWRVDQLCGRKEVACLLCSRY
jgi:Alpha/beta hydrolase domain containing 18